MVRREETLVEILTEQGWYRGSITMPAGGRLLDYLNTKPTLIALTSVRDPVGRRSPFMAINTDQVLAIRDIPRD
jgi:hypothetical protein